MPRAGLTPSLLTEAAAEIADAEGLDAVTVAALARRFGVQPASLYAHVGGTDDLRTRVTLLALEELADRVAESLAGRSGRDALAGLGEAHRAYAVAHPGRFAASRRRLDADRAAASAGPRLATMMRAVLRGYDLDDEAATHAVRLIGAVLLGFTTLELDGAFDHSDPAPAASWEHTLDGLDILLRSWSRP